LNDKILYTIRVCDQRVLVHFFDTLHKQVHGKETEVAESGLLFSLFYKSKHYLYDQFYLTHLSRAI